MLRRLAGLAGTRRKLEPYDLEGGRIKLTLLRVRSMERTIEHRYPGHHAAGPCHSARRSAAAP